MLRGEFNKVEQLFHSYFGDSVFVSHIKRFYNLKGYITEHLFSLITQSCGCVEKKNSSKDMIHIFQKQTVTDVRRVKLHTVSETVKVTLLQDDQVDFSHLCIFKDYLKFGTGLEISLDLETFTTFNRSLTFNRYFGDFEYGTCRRMTCKQRKREVDRQEIKKLKFTFKGFYTANHNVILFFFSTKKSKNNSTNGQRYFQFYILQTL